MGFNIPRGAISSRLSNSTKRNQHARGTVASATRTSWIRRCRSTRGLLGSLQKDILSEVMHPWRSHNEHRAEKVMRYLWSCCPTLEQIDWYPRLKTNMSSLGTLCRWKFVREDGDSNQRDSLARVTWDLHWMGCPQGDPEPIMNIRVGQEWEREMRKVRARYVMFYQDPYL